MHAHGSVQAGTYLPQHVQEIDGTLHNPPGVLCQAVLELGPQQLMRRECRCQSLCDPQQQAVNVASVQPRHICVAMSSRRHTADALQGLEAGLHSSTLQHARLSQTAPTPLKTTWHGWLLAPTCWLPGRRKVCMAHGSKSRSGRVIHRSIVSIKFAVKHPEAQLAVTSQLHRLPCPPANAAQCVQAKHQRAPGRAAVR